MVAAARIVLNDRNSGRIPYYTTPPKRGTKADRKHATAEVVTDWSKEFNAEKVFAEEENAVIAGLPGEEVGPIVYSHTRVRSICIRHCEVNR